MWPLACCLCHGVMEGFERDEQTLVLDVLENGEPVKLDEERFCQILIFFKKTKMALQQSYVRTSESESLLPLYKKYNKIVCRLFQCKESNITILINIFSIYRDWIFLLEFCDVWV